MGNNVGVESVAVAFDGLDKLRKRSMAPRFSGNLKAWRLSSDANRRCVTRTSPVDWANTTAFDDKSCYLLLHTYQVAEAETEGTSNSTVTDLAASASEGLTPRGLRAAFSCGEDNPNMYMPVGSTNPNNYSYGIFLWNGKSADAVVKATALTKAFELERLLLDESNVERLFNSDDALNTLQSALKPGSSGVSHTELTSFAANNELLSWLLNGPRKSSYEKEKLPAWPHVTDAITATKRERGDSNFEPRKRNTSFGEVGGAQAVSRVPPPKMKDLQLGQIGSLDIGGKQAVMGKTESAIRRAELERFSGVCSQVLPHLFVGAQRVAEDKELMQQTGITHIINCAGTVLENYHEGHFKYLKLYLYDAKSEDIGCLFYQICAFIDEAKQSGGKCFVHCHQGVSRSCTACMAYLLLRQACSYDDAFSKVQGARAICNPNTAFICQMLEWHRRLNEPMEKSRAFRVARHAGQPDSPFCARSISSGAPPPKRDECVVIHTPTRVFLWRGSGADAATLAEGELFVKRIQEHEGAPRSCETVDGGNEPLGFWNAASSCGFSIPHNAAASPAKIAELPIDIGRDARLAAEDEAMRAGNRHYTAPQQHAAPPPTQRSEPTRSEPTAFELIKMKQLAEEADGTSQVEPMSRRERREDEYATTAPVPKEENEDEGKLFLYPEWEELEMFDSDDLASDSAMVLLPNKKPVQCVYVWTGEEFLENADEGTIGAEIAGEFLAMRGLPSTTKVKLEVEADESDAFWDFFVNG